MCPICGVIFNKNNKSDITFHKRVHNDFLSGVISPKIKDSEKINIDGHEIICILPNSRAPLRNLVTKLLERASKDLGEAPSLPEKWKCYAEIKGKYAIGLLLIENNIIGTLKNGKTYKCPIGILRMWVITKERRTGVCTAMLDAARNNESVIVPYCSIAFSDPTEDGLAFATSYCGAEPYIYHIVL